ncbi:MAG: envelope stress response membrane protein PspB [Pseudomonadota bacterium]
MGVFAFILATVTMVFVVLPGVVLHYITEWKKTKTLSADDERLVDDLWQTAKKLERRVEALETILDNEAPTWRDDYPERPHA